MYSIHCIHITILYRLIYIIIYSIYIVYTYCYLQESVFYRHRESDAFTNYLPMRGSLIYWHNVTGVVELMGILYEPYQ